MFDKRAKNLIEGPCDNNRIILKGPTGSGKSTLLLERYKYMVDRLLVPSESILILLLNRTQSLEWRTRTVLEGSGAVLRTSYYGFIQSEIRTYYPIITTKCNEIVNKDMKPVFLTFEAAQFLVSTVIEWRRQNAGVFAGVTSFTDRLAIDLTSNLVRAAISDIPYNEIGDRLYSSLEKKDDLKRQIYKEADDILGGYRKRCLELGILDFGMAVDLYNNCLLKDDFYIKQLSKRIRHLIVDNIEECVPTEVDFINYLMPQLDSCLLSYNNEGGYGEAFGSNHQYVIHNLINNTLNEVKTVELDKSHTCTDFMSEFSDMLFDTIDMIGNGDRDKVSETALETEKISKGALEKESNGTLEREIVSKDTLKKDKISNSTSEKDKISKGILEEIHEENVQELQIETQKKIPKKSLKELIKVINGQQQKEPQIQPQIERVPAFELRSEMLEKIGEKIIDLIKEGFEPSDIVVVSNYADPVTEYVIGRHIERYGYDLKNLTRKSRVIDNPFTQGLITLAQLCHPKYGFLPNRDDVKALLRMVLKIDPVRSSILAGEIISQRPFAKFPDIEFPGVVERVGYYNIEKYEYIRNWIREYKERDNPLKINEFFQKVFLEVLISNEVSQKDILEAKKLIDSAKTFVEVVSRFRKNPSKDFLDVVRKGIKSAESIFELEEKLGGNFVLLSTPVAYLASSLKSRVTIIASLSSENWTPRSMKEITNLHVLTKTWDKNQIYTEEIEERNQKRYLAVLMRSMLKRCSDRLITYESLLSSNGYENNGILADYFDEILS